MSNPIFTHPGQPELQAEVILASKHPVKGQAPLVTMRLRYPRIIHGEIMTHRVFSRNARSSRAVPVKTMLEEVYNTPFVPWHWGKNQKGMQAGEECNEPVHNWMEAFIPQEVHTQFLSNEDAWFQASDMAIRAAEAFMEAGYHKQIANRLLEPFSWIDTLITSNRWENFLWLRDHGDAEPHLQDLARLVRQALDAAGPGDVQEGNWHLPYITENDRDYSCFDMGFGPKTPAYWEFLAKVSAARCARISYKPFDGDASYERELERFDSLVKSDRVHASPTEHQAKPDYPLNLSSGDWAELDNLGIDIDRLFWESPELHGNLPGWRQFRKTIANECHD